MIERFKALVIEHDEAEDMPASERLHWQVDNVERELERREGDQRHALFPLYAHPDIRIRYAAAKATRTLASALSRHRMLAIDDPDWAPPANVAGMSEAELDALFPKRSKARAAKRSNLQNMAVEQLVNRFIVIALEQDEALLMDQIPKYSRLYSQLEAAEEELKARDGDQRHALLPLLDHPNAQVRLKAAIATLAVAPEAARQTLQIISDRNEYPQAADARGMMRAFDERRFVPR